MGKTWCKVIICKMVLGHFCLYLLYPPLLNFGRVPQGVSIPQFENRWFSTLVNIRNSKLDFATIQYIYHFWLLLVHYFLYLKKYKENISLHTNSFNTHMNDALAKNVLHKGRKEMFYLTMHSAHFIYMALDIIMVKEHSDIATKPVATTWSTLSD